MTEPKQYDFAMEWRDLQIADVLADNLKRLRSQHGYNSNRALYLAMVEWSKTKPHIEPITINTLRNIEMKQNSPQIDTLNVIAEFYDMPPYALLMQGMRPDNDFLKTLELVVNVFMRDERARDAMKALASAFDQKSAA